MRAAVEAASADEVYVPQCDARGNYQPLQSHPGTGYRWCVDEHGHRIAGTNTPPGKPDPDCSLYNGLYSPSLALVVSWQGGGQWGNPPLKFWAVVKKILLSETCLLYTSPSPRD